MKTHDQAAREAISLVSLFLENNQSTDSAVQSSWGYLWDFVFNILKNDPDKTLVSRLKRKPNDPKLREKAAESLKKYLQRNQEELVRLSEILDTVRFEIPARSPRPITRNYWPEAGSPRTPDLRGGEEMMRSDRISKALPDLFEKKDTPDDTPDNRENEIYGLGAKFDEEPQQDVVRAKQKRSDRVVNTGFSTWDNPDMMLIKKLPLATGKKYLFCMDIGDMWEDTLETTPADIPALPQKDAILSVVVFGFPDGIKVIPGADRGEFEISVGDPARVTNQPITEESRQPSSGYLKTCLFFPVIMPTAPPKPEGFARMRCNIYWRNILLQSRLISARVVEDPAKFIKTRQKQIKSDLDYSLSGTLSPTLVNQLQPHSMSLLFNSNEDTQSIFIEGADRPQHIAFESGEIQDFIDNVRAHLRLISWGSKGEWNGNEYLYSDREPDLERLKRDLVYLAKWGYNFYFKVYERLEGEKKGKDAYEERLEKPGFIHIASRRSPNHLIPAAMIYDYHLNTSKHHIEYDLCPEFLDAFHEKRPLEDTPCFRGECPTRKRMKELMESHQRHLCTTICPSGFWGFRHFLGMPISLDHSKNAIDIPSSIPLGDKMIISSCISREMHLLKDHLKKLKTFVSSTEWNCADEDEELTPMLLLAKPHIIYFYCHGDIVDGTLQLRIGSREKSCSIDPTVLRYIIWENPRPLVFLNGCRTAGISPKQLLNFIEPLVTHSKGAGVIGTEITIFEELATEFFERFFEHFLDGNPVGDAIRHARLALLGQGNPLGLVYTPYILPSLKLIKDDN